jgi:hypothetical protein
VSQIEILENRDRWLAKFRKSWLTRWQETGEFDWKRYPHPKNQHTPAGPGLDLSHSRLVLVSSAGAYLPNNGQPAFEAAHPLGDYTIRLFPADTPLDQLAYAHDHYDHTAVEADPQVLIPLRHLEGLVSEGVIGELAPSVISFMGYQPVATRVIDELIPAILKASEAQQANAALLVPA